MEIFDNLWIGFSAAVSPLRLLYALIGVFLGTLIGVLPGIGPVATIAMLLPITFNLDPVAALIMLAGIYYGSQYGGSTTAILVNIPGETGSVVTCLDGYQMARQGRAGPALAIAALGSLVKAIAMVVLGLLLGLIGTDVNSGVLRFTFDLPSLSDGIAFVIVAMGMFGITEIVANLEMKGTREIFVKKITRLMPSKEDFKRSWKAVLRGTALGSFLGILPGGGSILASFGAYTLEKKVSDHPEQFGKGAIEGVAAPEAANNAGAQTSFIPMLTLGIPSNPVMALMIGAMIIQGIQPGPSVMKEQPALVWGIIVSMWIGNFFLVVLNLPLIGLWVRLIMVPYQLLYPAILVFCGIGVFSLNNSEFDIYLMALFGLLGYVFVKIGCEPAPMLLAFILGPLMEEYLRRAMLISRGNPWVFVQRPISATLLGLAVLAMCAVLIPAFSKTREEAFKEETI